MLIIDIPNTSLRYLLIIDKSMDLSPLLCWFFIVDLFLYHFLIKVMSFVTINKYLFSNVIFSIVD